MFDCDVSLSISVGIQSFLPGCRRGYEGHAESAAVSDSFAAMHDSWQAWRMALVLLHWYCTV